MRCDTSCDTCAFLVSQPKTLVYQAFSINPQNAVTRAISTCHSGNAGISAFAPCCDTCDTFFGDSPYACVCVCTHYSVPFVPRPPRHNHETLIYGRLRRARGRHTQWSSGTDRPVPVVPSVPILGTDSTSTLALSVPHATGGWWR